MHRWILKGFDQIQVGKDGEGQYWPSFGPGVPHATDLRQSKQQDQDTTPLTEEVNRGGDRDQEIIQDRETIKVQEKLEWISIEIRMDTKPEANREAELEELFQIETRTIKEENKAAKIENNHIKKDIGKCINITHILGRTSARQRIIQIGIGHIIMIIEIEVKAGVIIQMARRQKVKRYKRSILKSQ
ncbi:MAG: hypothetical protein EZS28_043256 [Streblomastix strix]|uniref:Uncharacterized protein n=1 Tax=Streblomastix strix TaxID=222440 RepID=A0A5J4TSK7_9EUKA|nr:MAG: hypothetical protein EZS28_043256 [Streblomastix strix]